MTAGFRLRVLLPAFVVALVAAGVAASTTGLPDEKVVGRGDRIEILPSADHTGKGVEVFAWSSGRGGQGSFNAYLRKGSGGAVKLNRNGAGFAGGIDFPLAAYQQLNPKRTDSNIKLYRIDTRKRLEPPKGVNTKDWEQAATISGKWLVFQRTSGPRLATNRLILFNRTTRKQRVLVTERSESKFIIAGQVAGNWVVWSMCGNPRCDVYVHNIAARKTTRLKKPSSPDPISNYSAGVVPSGVVYVVRSGAGCGTDVRIVRYRRAGDPDTGTEIATLPADRDVYFAFARQNPNGSVDFFHDRNVCGGSATDIYKVTDPAPPR